MDIPDSPEFIQEEETVRNFPASESMLQKIGGSINWILDHADQMAIGSIDASMLTLAQYQAARGPGWVLANGDPLAPTDKLRIIAGFLFVPDLRGMFLRMKGYGRVVSGSLVNPNELALGDYQADENLSHSHGVETDRTGAEQVRIAQRGVVKTLFTTGTNTGYYAAGDGYWDPSFTINNTPGGADEMRPPNVTINWFIRIN